MFDKRLHFSSHGSIQVEAFDRDGNTVFFDDLMDVGIDEKRFIRATTQLLGYLHGIDEDSVYTGTGKIEKRKAQVLLSDSVTVILPSPDRMSIGGLVGGENNDEHRHKYMRRQNPIDDFIRIQEARCYWQATMKVPACADAPMEDLNAYITIGPDIEASWTVYNPKNPACPILDRLKQPEGQNLLADLLRLLVNDAPNLTMRHCEHKKDNNTTIYYAIG